MTEPTRRRRTPVWALLLILAMLAVLPPVLWFGARQDQELSGTATGQVSAGGEQRDQRTNGTTVENCVDAPVVFEVDGVRYGGPTLVRGRCLTSGVEEVTVRYDPRAPVVFTTTPSQDGTLRVFIAVFAVGFLVVLAILLWRLWRHLRSGPARP